jgi:hypothetical protein
MIVKEIFRRSIVRIQDEGEGVRTVHDNVHAARIEDVLINSPEALPLLVMSLRRSSIAYDIPIK